MRSSPCGAASRAWTEFGPSSSVIAADLPVMRQAHAPALFFGVVPATVLAYIRTYDMLHRNRSRDAAGFLPPPSQVQCLGPGSSDPTSPRREASLFDLAPGE
ncbi:hypothetical protein MCP1_240028 [Candidatus Terasakiella magnetica]|nr:hypothetical protein MCP1_240028 [Candidatus Terasakiella magnetica]